MTKSANHKIALKLLIFCLFIYVPLFSASVAKGMLLATTPQDLWEHNKLTGDWRTDQALRAESMRREVDKFLVNAHAS